MVANPALVVVLDPQGRIVELNAAGAELLGVAPEAAIGGDWFAFVPAEQRETIRRVFGEIMAGRVPELAAFENDLVGADGRRRTLVWRNALLRDASGTITASVSTGIDVSGRVALERRLAGSEARYRGLFDNLDAGFAVHELVLDEAGRPRDFRFVQVNAAFERLFQLPAAAVVGRLASQVIPTDELQAGTLERYGRVVATGVPESFELHARVARRTFQVSAYRPEPGHFACLFTDVTAQRQVAATLEEALRRAEASEAKLRSMAEHTRDVLWTLDLATQRFTYVSPSIAALRGVTVEEAMAEPFGRALTPESAARAAEVMRRIGTPAEEDPHTGVYDQPCKDGSIKHVEITTTYLRDGGGRPVAVMGVSRDATERVRAERALARSETLYRSLFAASPSGVILVDLQGGILTFNENAPARLGYTPEEFGRLKVWEIDADDVRARVGERIAAVMAGEMLEFDTRHRHRDGSLRDVHIKLTRVDLPDGPAILSTWDDITEARRLEQELRLRLEERDERERWLQASQRVARLGHYVFDIQADRWTSSPVLDELFGIGGHYRRDATGWLELVHPDDREGMGAYLQALMAGGSRFDRIYRVGRAEDPPRWVHGLGDLERDAAGRPLRMVGTIQDITARHQAELAQEALAEQLRQAQRLESIGRLAGGVAHDFNNILVVLLGCADAMRRSLVQGQPPVLEDVEELQEAARRAKDLTSQLLAFARRRVVAPVVLDLNEEVRRAERMLQRLLGEDVRLELRLQPGLPPVTFDPGQLQQVLLNLAVNSRDAMPSGGRLTISTAELAGAEPAEPGNPPWQGTPVAPGPRVRLAVEDTGAGIPRELWPRVFEPFVTSKPVGRGTGLGLATVYGIVQQAGGAIRFRSDARRGTTFEILLTPAAAAAGRPAEASPEPQAGAAAPTGQRLLVVEDDELVRAAACRALRQAGYQVTAADGGAEVRRLLEQGLERPALLLTDVVMPAMNGRQVAELARAAWPGLPVLFMSGYAQDIIVHHGVVDAGLDLLEKPFTSEALVARVRAALAR